MNTENLAAYRLIERHYSEDLKSEAYLLEHIKSGAKICVLENDDPNKVFYIAFRTPPTDSTGVAHILEHSVLCGSKKYPLKDPFVELAKGSLNTFLNAMTYPDKTVYPVASCNDQDFKNLCDVYMDAVLNPNIRNEEKIFRQEGWHYETDENDEIILNGVVYNEMKGVFSSPDDVLAREIFSSLYPDTTYGVESGGDPEVIPELTYKAFLDFHASYYHPVNSYIYLYGNADMEERLAWLDEAYLKDYERITIESHPGLQKPFEKPLELRKEYPVSEGEGTEKKTYLSYNATVSTVLDPELYIAFQMIDYALVAADGTPLRKALIKEGIGTEILSTYENGIYQPYYSIVAKNADESDRDRFLEVVERVLKQVSEEGFDEKALLACINSMEFHFREADTGRYPKGLIYGLKALDSWIYDSEKPFMHIEPLELFEKLRKKIGSSYFSELVKKYLIDNPHKSVLVLAPKGGLTAEKDEKLRKKLADYKKSLSPEEFEKLKADAEALKLYQSQEDDEEIKKCLPRLKRSDLRREAADYTTEVTELAGSKTLFHEKESNGIVYLNLFFFMDSLPVRLYPYAGMLPRILGSMDTENHSYEELGYETDIHTGNLGFSLDAIVRGEDGDDYSRYFNASLYVLKSEIEKGVELLGETLFTSKLEDKERLKEIIAETRSGKAGAMMTVAHGVAYGRALSYLSKRALAKDFTNGLSAFRCLERWEKEFDSCADDIIAGLKEAMSYIFTKENLLIDVTGSRQELEALKGKLDVLVGGLGDTTPAAEPAELKPELKNEGFTFPGQIQYVCRAGNFKKHGLGFTGAMKVLKNILSYGYLWNEVRVKGGAYGCMLMFSRYGDSHFVSYRDPNLEKTVDVFEKLPEYIREFTADEDQMTKYIIGTLSETDIPDTPRSFGEKSANLYLSGIDKEYRQKIRNQILDATDADIRALAAHVQAILDDNALCVVGSEEKIKASGGLFMNIENLVNG
ncbi:MAG: insulinase family protein [Lachnospiraceae bacterium]|nr:insulinase family protein [Lachnospiraceae bacterium]